MSRAAMASSGDNSRRARSNTSAASSFNRPSERGLTRSKSVGAIGRSAQLYREWAVTRTRSGSTGNKPSDVPPRLAAKDVLYRPEVLEQPKTERAKTPVKSTSNGSIGGSGGGGGGGAESHTSTFASIAAKVRPKLASFTSLRRSKGHHVSKSASATPTTNTPPQIPFICIPPEEPVPPPPPSFARLVPREPVIRRSFSLCDVKRGAKPPRPTNSNLNALRSLPNLPRPKTSGGPSKPEETHSISRSPAEKSNGDQPRPRTAPTRTVNRHATVYAPAPSVPVPSSQSSRSSRHPVKPSLSLTLPNGVSIVHEPLLLSPVPSIPSIRAIPSIPSPVTPPPSRPPPRAHLPESPNDFNFGFDIKPESWDAPTFFPRPPSAAVSIASYYYTATEANADYRDVITRYIELGDMESVRSLEIRNNGGWAAPSSLLKVPHAGPDGSTKSSAHLLPLDRRSMLPTPEPIGNGKFPPLPPPPTPNKRLPPTPTTGEEAAEYADESTQVLRLRRSPSSRSRLTPVTPDTPQLLTPKSNMALPLLAPGATYRAEEMPYLPNQELSVLAKQPSLKIRSKRSLRRPATGFETVN